MTIGIREYEFCGATFKIHQLPKGGYAILAILPVYKAIEKPEWCEGTPREDVEVACRKMFYDHTPY